MKSKTLCIKTLKNVIKAKRLIFIDVILYNCIYVQFNIIIIILCNVFTCI